jgi:hypothetical protein
MTMMKLAIACAVAAVAGVIASPVGAQAPYPGRAVEIGVYADTVSSSRGDVKLARVCTQTNSFPRKARVVFRSWAVDTKSGKALGADEIRYAYVKIPGQPNLALNWGSHGAVGNKVNFWSAAWAIPADYPLGVVPFKIVFKTEDGRFGTYTQPPLSSAQLTVIP